MFLMVAFVTSYIGAFHDPTPRRLPVALVAPTAHAQQMAARLNGLPGRPLSVRITSDRRAALRQIDDRDVYGAYEATNNRLYVASAANLAAATALRLTIDAVLASQKLPAATAVDVKPLPASDRNGTASFYAVIAWVFGGYFAATLLGLVGGPRSSTRRVAARRLIALTGFALLGSLLTLLIARSSFGVLEGRFVATWLAGAMIVLSAGAATAGLQALAGALGEGLVILLFVILGNPASGGPYARPLLPGLWRTVGGLLPPGAGVDLLRGIAYFDGAMTAGPLAVLAAWGVLGAAVAVYRGGRTLTPAEAEGAAAAAAAAA